MIYEKVLNAGRICCVDVLQDCGYKICQVFYHKLCLGTLVWFDCSDILFASSGFACPRDAVASFHISF